MNETPEPEPVPVAFDVMAQALSARPLHGAFPKPTGQAAARFKRLVAGKTAEPEPDEPTTERTKP